MEDRFLSNGDQSDRRVYRPVTPRVGLLHEIPAMGGALFANASQTVEPPLVLELTSFGNAGGFIDLEARRSRQYVVGARGRCARDGIVWGLSLFDIELHDEILNLNVQPFPGAPFTVPTYRNAPRTRHAGLEAGLAWRLPVAILARGDVSDHLTARVAYTLARFTYVDDPDHEGNEIPGAPRHPVNAELGYTHPAGFSLAPSVEWVPRSYFVNSDNTVTNHPWTSFGIRAEWGMPRIGFTAFVAAQNLSDRRYSGSVQVDNAAGRFFEPADRRSAYGGLRWSR